MLEMNKKLVLGSIMFLILVLTFHFLIPQQTITIIDIPSIKQVPILIP